MARKLFQAGMLCNGQVEFVRPATARSPNNIGAQTFEVTYRFRDNAGVERMGKMATDNAWLVNQLRVGAPIVVAYDPQKPQKNIFLEPFVA